ncbi:hypothetical protein [Fusobacterium sp.]|uniref:hypothetical protein n=1 Tax=Fusobacterium sp. TaxID=68766 RepID=UPI002617131A|nr:hypothetical protein [Fusobacterium sp.]
MKKILGVIILLVIAIMIFHNKLLIKISIIEREIYVEKRYAEDAEKELSMIKMKYEQKIDLKSFEKEMNEKKKMEITTDINYFSTEKETEE